MQVREEQALLRPDLDATVTGSVLYDMKYTRQVVKEVLRYRCVPASHHAVCILRQKAAGNLGATVMQTPLEMSW